MVVDGRVLSVVMFVAVACVAIRPVWRVARYPVTAVHELGHLVVAFAVGGRRLRVRLRADTSGLTTWRAAEHGRGRAAFIALTGPAAPPVVGAACAAAFATGYATAGVIGLAVGVGVITMVVRNLWGLVVCAALGAVCWLALRYGAGAADVLMVATATLLCLGGVRAVTEEMAYRPPDGTSDTQVASRALWLPASAWGVALLAWALAWAAVAAWWVVPAL